MRYADCSPGASSLLGLLLENGPLHVTDTGSMAPNNFSWNQFVDYIWVDQPVCVLQSMH